MQHIYIYGGTPPLTLAVMEPGTEQVLTVITTTIGGGDVMVAVAVVMVLMQLLLPLLHPL